MSTSGRQQGHVSAPGQLRPLTLHTCRLAVDLGGPQVVCVRVQTHISDERAGRVDEETSGSRPGRERDVGGLQERETARKTLRFIKVSLCNGDKWIVLRVKQ